MRYPQCHRNEKPLKKEHACHQAGPWQHRRAKRKGTRLAFGIRGISSAPTDLSEPKVTSNLIDIKVGETWRLKCKFSVWSPEFSRWIKWSQLAKLSGEHVFDNRSRTAKILLRAFQSSCLKSCGSNGPTEWKTIWPSFNGLTGGDLAFCSRADRSTAQHNQHRMNARLGKKKIHDFSG